VPLARSVDGGVASTQLWCAPRLPIEIEPGSRAHPPPKFQGEMPMKFQKLTPNLVVRDVAAAMEFYRSVLGFQPAIKVPDQAPYVFASVTNGGVEIFFNDQKAVAADYPALGSRPIGGALTLFIEVE